MSVETKVNLFGCDSKH